MAFCDSKEVFKSFEDITRFKLAVLDIRMSNINGLQLYSIIKSLSPNVKMLFMTALDAVNEITGLMVDIYPNEDIMRKPIGQTSLYKK